MLVIVHHLAITYGASGSWYFRDPAAPDSFGLSILAGLDQAFFMGLFFFVSGYFTPHSLERKGAARFLADRAVRLLVPALLFAIVIAPGLEYVKRTSLDLPTPPLLAYYPERLADLRELDPGPLWFVWALFLFDVGYVGVRALVPPRAPTARRLAWSGLAALAGMIAILTIAVRARWPIGENVLRIQVAYVPQYVLLFAAGIAAARRRSLDELPAHLGWVGGLGAVLGFATWLVAGHIAEGRVNLLIGGIGPPAMLYAVGESLLCVGISIALVVGFQRRAWTSGPISSAVADGAFATYVLHAPVIVVLALVLACLAAPPLVKLALAVTLAMPCCFALGILAHRTPVLRRIL